MPAVKAGPEEQRKNRVAAPAGFTGREGEPHHFQNHSEEPTTLKAAFSGQDSIGSQVRYSLT